MAATSAQIAANRANALRFSGPKTVEGKEASRRNALKHGLTAQTVPVEAASEVEERAEGVRAMIRPRNAWQAT